MRFAYWFIAAAIVLPLATNDSATSQAAEPVRLRVLSYNIHHGEGVDGKLDLERIAGVIRSVKPDLVALQEVDVKTERTGRVDQAAELARLTKMNVVFGPNISFQGGEYGNAVLSRFTIARHKNHQLPNIDDGEQRGVLEAEIKLPNSDRHMLFFATHLDHRQAGAERLASAKVINQLVTGDPERPALLAGDLNDTVGSEPLLELALFWTMANRKPLPTVPVGQPKKQIDFVLFRPAKRWKAIETRILNEAVASDHRAILAVVELMATD